MPYADQRTLAGTDAVLSWQALDGNGIDRDPGTVTVSVASSNGTALVTNQATTGTGANPRIYTLAASLIPTPERLTATWMVSGTAVATTTCEVVGGYIASLSAIFGRFPGLAEPSKWPRSQVIEARNGTEDEFHNACAVAFVPRFATATLRGSGHRRLIVPHQELRQVAWATYRTDGSTTEIAFTSQQLASIEASGTGLADFTDSSYWPHDATISIGYSHGYDAAPADVVDAFMIRLNDVLSRRNSSLPSRAITMSSPDGVSTSLAVPGWGTNLTGIPDVDTVLKRYNRSIPGLA